MKTLLMLVLVASAALAQDSATIYGPDGSYRGNVQFHQGLRLQQPVSQPSIPLVALERQRQQQASPFDSYMNAQQLEQSMRTEALQQKLLQQQIEIAEIQNRALTTPAGAALPVAVVASKAKPVIDTFATYDAYIDALIDWKLAQVPHALSRDSRGCVTYTRRNGTEVIDCE